MTNYSTTGNDANYLLKTGGTMTGNLSISDPTGVNSSTFIRPFNIIGTQSRICCWSSSSTLVSGIDLISAPTTGTTIPTTFTSRWDFSCGNSTLGHIFLFRQRTTGTANTYFVIGPTGNVGIGTTHSATYKLDVSGSINSTFFFQKGTQIDFSSYATITNLNTKQNTLTFSSPLINTSNNISIDLSGYPFKTNVDASLNSLSTNKQNIFTCITPLIKNDISNNISKDLSAYPLKTNNDASLNSLNNNKQNNLTFSNPFLNTSNTISLKLNSSQFNIDSSGNLNLKSNASSQWTTSGTNIL